MGLSMVESIKSVREQTKSGVDMRVGVHTGGVLAGVLGQRQWQFDVYSKDVELANKMESSGLPGRVHISDATLRFLNDEFEVSPGDGASREEALRLANITTYFIDKVKKPYPEGTLDAVKESVGSMKEVGPTAGVPPPPPPAVSGGETKSKERYDSFNLDNQIKRFSLNFSNRQFERQFRSTSDIASCISLIGLPITLLCAFGAYVHLYKVQTEVAIVYASNFSILLLVVLICILPYLWRDQAQQQQQQQCLTNSIMSIANSVSQSAWMKLALTAFMTLIWLAAHLIAAKQTSENLNKITDSKALQLFTVDLFNYFSIACSLAITAVTRISFSVKTLIILVVILLQVIMNVTFLSSVLSVRLASSLLPSIGPTNQHQQAAEGGGDMTPLTLMIQMARLADGSATTASQDHHYFDQYIFTLTLITICWALFLINRQFELTNRRLFLWRKQVEQRKEKVADMREKNEALVYNILPPNVAKIFLGKRTINDDGLYSKSYDSVGVLFAAMPNFSDFYSEESVNNQGLECLRFLNEVISDYDALLDQARFKNIIKIKTMGSTYMAASGLYEGDALEAAGTNGASAGGGGGEQAESEDEIRAKWGHLEQLTEFALALKDTLNNINKESFNNFVLRIGKLLLPSFLCTRSSHIFSPLAAS